MGTSMDDDESMIDEYLDAAGMVRTFRLTVHAGGRFLEAIERCGAAWAGLRFLLPVPAGEPPPWGEMRAQIRAWRARRDVARHPRSGRLGLVARSLRARSPRSATMASRRFSSTTSRSHGASWAACSRATKGGT